jgi:hypothetical protein
MNKPTIFAFVVAASLAWAGPARADVRVTMHDGLVSVVARDATVRQILAEWARVGQTTIVNADRIAGAPLTIELSELPEKQALDILLRTVNGYLAAPRPSFVPNASRFDRIIVMPTSTQPRSSTASSAPPPLPQPRFTEYQLPRAPQEPDDAPAIFTPNDPAQRQPVVNVFTPPMPGAPPPAAGRTSTTPATFAAPTAPVGTATPGVVMQPPQPVQPGPGQPTPVPPVPIQPGRLF